jgi:N-acetylmuramoyl-L-alanine amidase
MHRCFPVRPFITAMALLAACAPTAPPPAAPPPPQPPPTVPPPEPRVGLPAVPRVDGPLQIRVVHPTPATPRPNVAATFIFGSVGTGDARLRINGSAVEVHPNGAFLAYLPTPADGRWVLDAEAHGERRQAVVQYRMPTPGARPAAPAPTTTAFPQPRIGLISGGADTLATGSDVSIGRPTPTGPYRWFLPRGAQVAITGRRGEQLRARLGSGTDAWFPASAITLGEGATWANPRPVGTTTVVPGAAWLDLRVAVDHAPFLVDLQNDRLVLTVYDRTARDEAIAPLGFGGVATEMVGVLRWSPEPGVGARLEAPLAHRVWGYKAFYDADGTLVLRLRRQPLIDPHEPLRGMRIVVDPGHPPAGAVGPTGLTEAEANLNIALPLAEMLRQRGADVVLTRTANVPVSLVERVNLAKSRDAHLLVSVHNNAFPEGADPFRRHGTSTYHFHRHSEALARALQREIQATTRIRDLGVITGNLALVRPTWMPTVLTESLFMMLPDQEAALRDPEFTRRLAEAHLRGIERFLREAAAR